MSASATAAVIPAAIEPMSTTVGGLTIETHPYGVSFETDEQLAERHRDRVRLVLLITGRARLLKGRA